MKLQKLTVVLGLAGLFSLSTMAIANADNIPPNFAKSYNVSVTMPGYYKDICLGNSNASKAIPKAVDDSDTFTMKGTITNLHQTAAKNISMGGGAIETEQTSTGIMDRPLLQCLCNIYVVGGNDPMQPVHLTETIAKDADGNVVPGWYVSSISLNNVVGFGSYEGSYVKGPSQSFTNTQTIRDAFSPDYPDQFVATMTLTPTS